MQAHNVDELSSGDMKNNFMTLLFLATFFLGFACPF